MYKNILNLVDMNLCQNDTLINSENINTIKYKYINNDEIKNTFYVKDNIFYINKLSKNINNTIYFFNDIDKYKYIIYDYNESNLDVNLLEDKIYNVYTYSLDYNIKNIIISFSSTIEKFNSKELDSLITILQNQYIKPKYIIINIENSNENIKYDIINDNIIINYGSLINIKHLIDDDDKIIFIKDDINIDQTFTIYYELSYHQYNCDIVGIIDNIDENIIINDKYLGSYFLDKSYSIKFKFMKDNNYINNKSLNRCSIFYNINNMNNSIISQNNNIINSNLTIEKYLDKVIECYYLHNNYILMLVNYIIEPKISDVIDLFIKNKKLKILIVNKNLAKNMYYIIKLEYLEFSEDNSFNYKIIKLNDESEENINNNNIDSNNFDSNTKINIVNFYSNVDDININIVSNYKKINYKLYNIDNYLINDNSKIINFLNRLKDNIKIYNNYNIVMKKILALYHIYIYGGLVTNNDNCDINIDNIDLIDNENFIYSKEKKSEHIKDIFIKLCSSIINNDIFSYLYSEKFNYIDHVVWINMDKSVDRKMHMEKLLENIPNTRISAIDVSKINENSNINKCTTYQELCCTLSHIKAISTLEHMYGKYFCVCEDDIGFNNLILFDDNLQDIIENAPDFDILMICKVCPFELTNTYSKWEDGYHICSTACYIITKEGVDKFLTNVAKYNSNNTFDYKYDISVADHFIYNYMNTIVYKYNFINTIDKNSTIHENHIAMHQIYTYNQRKIIIDNIL